LFVDVFSYCLGSSENVDNGETAEINGHIPEKQIQHRANTTMHVCWHRNTSVSLRDHDKSVRVSQ
jgi:FERM/RhoGEF/pleckstrin domain protein 2